MARILVTGSRGTLGHRLVKELRLRGHDVWQCDLQHCEQPQCLRADVADYRQLERVFERKYDYVYHLAAEFGRLNGEEYYDTLWQTNVIGTRNILEIQRRDKFRLIFASSSEIYGDRHEAVLSEDIPLQQAIIQHNDYATTKWVSDGLLAYMKVLECVTCSRPSAVRADWPAWCLAKRGGRTTPLPVMLRFAKSTTTRSAGGLRKALPGQTGRQDTCAGAAVVPAAGQREAGDADARSLSGASRGVLCLFLPRPSRTLERQSLCESHRRRRRLTCWSEFYG